MRILIIEGQFNLPIIRNQLILPMLKRYPGAFEYVSAAWNSGPLGGPFDIVIGHSLGGNRAINYCSLVHPPPNHLITLDPRWMSNFGWTDIFFRWLNNFIAPAHVHCLNAVHIPATLFPGYKVYGATNVSLFTTHLTIAGHPLVAERFEAILKLEGAI